MEGFEDANCCACDVREMTWSVTAWGRDDELAEFSHGERRKHFLGTCHKTPKGREIDARTV